MGDLEVLRQPGHASPAGTQGQCVTRGARVAIAAEPAGTAVGVEDLLSCGLLRRERAVEVGDGIGRISHPQNEITQFLPDGRLLCSTPRGDLGILDPQTGRVVRLLEASGERLHSVAYLGARPRPPLLPSRVAPEKESNPERSGFLLCQSVFASRQAAADWRRVKGVRVFIGDPLTTRSAWHPYAHIGVEGIELGTVPLAGDGSFHVEVPAGRPLALQAVDAEGRAVVSELSWIYVRPGEQRSCTGCHARSETAPSTSPPLAAGAPPFPLLSSAFSHRFRANSASNGGVLNLQLDRFREAASIDLYPQPPLAGEVGAAALPPGRPAEVAKLSRMLSSGEAPQRAAAAQRLGILRDRAATAALSGALADGEPVVRAGADLALAAAGTREAVPPLVEALGDPQPVVAQAAKTALEHLTGRSEEFEPYAGEEARAAGRKRWRKWLAACDWARLEAELISRLDSPDPVTVHLAVAAIGHIGGEAARQSLRGLVRPAPPRPAALITRLEVIRALGHLRDREAVPLLSELLEEESAERPWRAPHSHELGWAQEPVQVAAAAAEALGWIGTAEAETALLRAFGKLAPFWYYTYRSVDHEWLMGCHSSLPHYRIIEALDAIGSRRAAPIAGAPQRRLPADPAGLRRVEEGEALFGAIGCARCHVPELPGAEGLVRAYSDFLLHDVGDPGRNYVGEPDCEPREFRTAPLWGLRDTAPYLHDGSAETVTDAILGHFGEATVSRRAFEALSLDDRWKIVQFLLSL
jgi:HEAT repeat protein